jgi:retinol dehydrogenase-12
VLAACHLTPFVRAVARRSLGYEAALHFARLDISTLIFAVRNPKKAETAEQQLYKDVPSFRGQIKVIKLDYDSFESVRSFVREVDSSVDRLDFAVLNAGVTNQTYQQTPDGWVQDIQVNVLSTGLLAALLLPKLSGTAKLPPSEKASSDNLKPQLHIVSSEGKRSQSAHLCHVHFLT